MCCIFRRAILLLLLVCALGLPTLPARAEDPLEAIDRGMTLLRNGDIDAARTTLSAIGDGEAPDATLLAARGMTEAFAGNSAAAEVLFRHALEQDPRSVAALWGLSLNLLQRKRVFEASALIDRAAVAAPTDARVKTLQAYAYLLLGRTADAAVTAKIALDAGQPTPFLLATLAQIHRNLGYTKKAVEFGRLAAKTYYGMDFLATERRVQLPLTLIIADAPQALDPASPARPAPQPAAQRTDLAIEIPRIVDVPTTREKPVQIVAPRDGAVVRGPQRVRVTTHGGHAVSFVVLQVDHVTRGLLTGLPYQFAWDADAVTPGRHQLVARAYDDHGLVIGDDTVTVEAPSGQAPVTPEPSERVLELQRRMVALDMPLPAPLSLFTQLGWWNKEAGDAEQAQIALEKAAAIDPSTEGVLSALNGLYLDNGMHFLTPSGDLTRGPAGKDKRVALTFDDGPTPLYTPTILNELKRYNAHATFFLVGKMAEKYPEQVLQILAQGHELGNHSYTHRDMTKLTGQEVIAEVLRTRTALKEIAGQQTYLFRPPGGDIDPAVTKQLHMLDYNIVFWDVNAGEFRKAPTPAAQAAQIIQHVQSGSILLLHNGLVDGTLNFLPMLLDGLAKRGYSFVTVSELMHE